MKSSNTIVKSPTRIKKGDLERIDLDIFDSSADASLAVAERIAELVKHKAA